MKPSTSSADSPHRIVEAKFVAALATPKGTLPPPTFTEIAFAGRSNVGKSSLINALVDRKGLVRTSGTPGCTRQINLFEVRAKDGAMFGLVDLPGYGFAKRSKDERRAWGNLIEGFLSTRVSLRTLVVLVDARRGFEEDDVALVEFARDGRARDVAPLGVVIVATKLDKLPSSARAARLRDFSREASLGGGAPIIGHSTITGQGKDDLWRAIRKVSLGEPAPAGEIAGKTA
jgi:GTP-binding protein